MVFVKVALVKDLEPGKMIGVEAEGKEILIVNFEGNYFAIGNRCTHAFCMLSDGSLKGQDVARANADSRSLHKLKKFFE